MAPFVLASGVKPELVDRSVKVVVANAKRLPDDAKHMAEWMCAYPLSNVHFGLMRATNASRRMPQTSWHVSNGGQNVLFQPTCRVASYIKCTPASHDYEHDHHASARAIWQDENVNVITIISLVFVAIGVAILVVACWSAVQAAKSRQWPRCVGAVRSSTVETDYNEGVLYRAAVSYVYQVEDQEFGGSRVRFCDWLMLGWSYPAKRIVREFPAGKSVSVYYDSNDPGESVLEPGLNWFVVGSFAFGAIFLLIGLAAAFATS